MMRAQSSERQGPALEADVRSDVVGLQVLRFIAALMVVVVHSTFYVNERLLPDYPVWHAGAAGVDIFFVISGFVMYYAYSRRKGGGMGASQFYIKRLIRIVPPYWGVTVLKVMIMIAVPGVAMHATLSDFSYILKSFLFIPAYNAEGRVEPLVGVGWTLLFEMFFYTIFSIGLALRANPLFFCTGILLPLALFSPFKSADWPAFAVYLSPLNIEFLFGMLLVPLLGLAKGAQRRIAPAAIGVGVVLLLLHERPLGLIDMTMYRALPAALIVGGVAALDELFSSRREARLIKMMVFLGGASYSLYLIHPIVSPAVPHILERLNFRNASVSIIGSVAAAVLASSLMYIAVERPVTKRLGGMYNRWLLRRAGEADSAG